MAIPFRDAVDVPRTDAAFADIDTAIIIIKTKIPLVILFILELFRIIAQAENETIY